MAFFHRTIGQAYYTAASQAAASLGYLAAIRDMLGADLEAQWNLDSDSSVADLTGNGWTMTVTGTGTITTATGPTIGSETFGALSASGGTRRMATATSFTGASATTGRTIIVWANLAGASSGYEFLLGRLTTGDGEIAAYSHSTGTLYAEAQQEDGSSEIASPNGSTDMDDAGWVCCFAWWDPADDDVYVQLDTGTPVSEAGSTDINTDCAAPFTILASDTGGSPTRSGGLVALPMVVNRVLTSDERASIATGVF